MEELFSEELIIGGQKCAECAGHYGIHSVLCPRFKCQECGHRGADEDHRGGCPTKRQNEVRWQCQCGAFGWMRPTRDSLAGQVRQARREHKPSCGDPDIERLEKRPDYERRKIQERIHPDVF